MRVLTLLGIADLFEGLVFCDYARPDGEFGCKPETGFFREVRPASFRPPFRFCALTIDLVSPLPF
jgi:hypothetical protein